MNIISYEPPTWFLYIFSRFEVAHCRKIKNIVRGFLRFPFFPMRKSIKSQTVFIMISIHFKTLKYSKYSKPSVCFQFYSTLSLKDAHYFMSLHNNCPCLAHKTFIEEKALLERSVAIFIVFQDLFFDKRKKNQKATKQSSWEVVS